MKKFSVDVNFYLLGTYMNEALPQTVTMSVSLEAPDEKYVADVLEACFARGSDKQYQIAGIKEDK